MSVYSYKDIYNESLNVTDCCNKSKQPVLVKTSSDWSLSDYLGSFKCRVSNSFRMKYGVEPALYLLGVPDDESDVFVSANYKLSFDILRKALEGLSVWILVIDTKGINVWCAAAKGTFGAKELSMRMNEVGLADIVNHRRIIVPQLGAAGISAGAVFKHTGFKVCFGPVYAKDIKGYLSAGRKKTHEMRRINFSMTDRLILTPIEIIPLIKKFLVFTVIILLFFGLRPSGILFENAWLLGKPFLLLGLGSIIGGAFITPILLPFIPFRSFALKGWMIGILLTLTTIFSFNIQEQKNILIFMAEIIFFPMASSYLALQFTGSTTFTNISGVKKELKIALPVYFVSALISIVLMLIYKIGILGVL
ncbi:mercury methylation corrinoid protein HgcA [Candidatus Acidulodesulfobacterium sp. H_13]|uniref:mercury methylation corrinoid protein HgcA n=1 Tax=Candidatus Acidulodesulfobacterium sp. H_13 TaxID=3395470 RepID=UPI003AF6D6C7